MIIKSIQNCNKQFINNFSCGNTYLDEYFHKYAFSNDINNIGKTFVLEEEEEEIIGFYTLANMHLENKDLTKEERKVLPRYPMPSIRIARFAINKKYQNKKYGSKLIKDVFLRILSICNETAIKFIVVDAKPESKKFYEKYSFVSLPKKEFTLILAIETVKEALIK